MTLIINTKKGKVKGFETEGVNAWFGIPFAEPPVGELRFKRAQSVKNWGEVKDCSEFGNDPIQFVQSREKENEDCLNLNVWAPKNANKLPVMVWLYGGGLHYGFNSDPSYDGAHMSSNGVVRVNVNFRLGPLGYYDFNQFDSTFDTNCALSDQLEALRWVKENIEAFGGDPNNVTIFGESGGGVAVFNLLASPAAEGLFQKAIAQSGLPYLGGTRENSKLLMPHFLEYIGLKEDEIEKLKTMDISKIKDAGSRLYHDFVNVYEGIGMPGPFYGDDLLPERPWTALKNGSAKNVAVIIGYNRDEGDTFLDTSDVVQAWFPSWQCVEQMLRNNGKENYFSELKELYTKNTDERKALSNFVTDYLFAKDSYRCADEQVAHGNVWMYRFDFVPLAYKQMNLGAVHSVEIPFALDTLDLGYFSYALRGTAQEQLDAVRDQINNAWLQFAKNGNPAGGTIEWSPYTSYNSPLHIFDLEPSNQAVRLEKRIFELWEEMGPMYDQD